MIIKDAVVWSSLMIIQIKAILINITSRSGFDIAAINSPGLKWQIMQHLFTV